MTCGSESALARIIFVLTSSHLPLYGAVIALAALHYVVAAVATRAASGLRLPLLQTTLVQLVASSANRISAAGLGGSAVNTRYFVRRGMDVAGAAGAVATLGVLGAVADILTFGLLALLGRLLGFAGAGAEFTILLRHAHSVAHLTSNRWVWLASPLIVGAATMATYRWRSSVHRWLDRLLRPSAISS